MTYLFTGLCLARTLCFVLNSVLVKLKKMFSVFLRENVSEVFRQVYSKSSIQILKFILKITVQMIVNFINRYAEVGDPKKPRRGLGSLGKSEDTTSALIGQKSYRLLHRQTDKKLVCFELIL